MDEPVTRNTEIEAGRVALEVLPKKHEAGIFAYLEIRYQLIGALRGFSTSYEGLLSVDKGSRDKRKSRFMPNFSVLYL